MLSSLQVFIVLSCLISVSVNFSTFLVIGKTSPVTYQVLGHLKTCLVLAFGYVLLHNPFSWRNIFGILIALVGMILYSYFCSLESQQKASEASTQLSQVPWNILFYFLLLRLFMFFLRSALLFIYIFHLFVFWITFIYIFHLFILWNLLHQVYHFLMQCDISYAYRYSYCNCIVLQNFLLDRIVYSPFSIQ